MPIQWDDEPAAPVQSGIKWDKPETSSIQWDDDAPSTPSLSPEDTLNRTKAAWANIQRGGSPALNATDPTTGAPYYQSLAKNQADMGALSAVAGQPTPDRIYSAPSENKAVQAIQSAGKAAFSFPSRINAEFDSQNGAAVMNKINESVNTDPTITNQVASGVGGMVPALAMNTLIPGSMPFVMAAEGIGGKRAEISNLRDQGRQISGGQEAAAAAGSGALNYVFGKVGMNIANKLAVPGGSIISNLPRYVAGNALEGAVTAPIQTAAENVIAGQTYDPNRPAMEGVGESAIVGGLTQGVAMTPLSAVHGVQLRAQRQAMADAGGRIVNAQLKPVDAPKSKDGYAADTLLKRYGNGRHLWVDGMPDGVNGFVDPQSGAMYLNSKNPTEALRKLAAHELQHIANRDNPQAFEQFVGQNADLVDLATRRYAETNGQLRNGSEQLQADEGVGYLMERIVDGDPAIIDALNKRGWGEWLKDASVKLVADLGAESPARRRLVQKQVKLFDVLAKNAGKVEPVLRDEINQFGGLRADEALRQQAEQRDIEAQNLEAQQRASERQRQADLLAAQQNPMKAGRMQPLKNVAGIQQPVQNEMPGRPGMTDAERASIAQENIDATQRWDRREQDAQAFTDNLVDAAARDAKNVPDGGMRPEDISSAIGALDANAQALEQQRYQSDRVAAMRQEAAGLGLDIRQNPDVLRQQIVQARQTRLAELPTKELYQMLKDRGMKATGGREGMLKALAETSVVPPSSEVAARLRADEASQQRANVLQRADSRIGRTTLGDANRETVMDNVVRGAANEPKPAGGMDANEVNRLIGELHGKGVDAAKLDAVRKALEVPTVKDSLSVQQEAPNAAKEPTPGGDVVGRAEAVVPAETKQPWEMTKNEFEKVQSPGDLARNLRTHMDRQSEFLASKGLTMEQAEKMSAKKKAGLDREYKAMHQGTTLHSWAVKSAVREGKPVPAEVLADYPDLTPTGKQLLQVQPVPAESTVSNVGYARSNESKESLNRKYYSWLAQSRLQLREIYDRSTGGVFDERQFKDWSIRKWISMGRPYPKDALPAFPVSDQIAKPLQEAPNAAKEPTPGGDVAGRAEKVVPAETKQPWEMMQSAYIAGSKGVEKAKRIEEHRQSVMDAKASGRNVEFHSFDYPELAPPDTVIPERTAQERIAMQDNDIQRLTNEIDVARQKVKDGDLSQIGRISTLKKALGTANKIDRLQVPSQIETAAKPAKNAELPVPDQIAVKQVNPLRAVADSLPVNAKQLQIRKALPAGMKTKANVAKVMAMMGETKSTKEIPNAEPAAKATVEGVTGGDQGQSIKVPAGTVQEYQRTTPRKGTPERPKSDVPRKQLKPYDSQADWDELNARYEDFAEAFHKTAVAVDGGPADTQLWAEPGNEKAIKAIGDEMAKIASKPQKYTIDEPKPHSRPKPHALPSFGKSKENVIDAVGWAKSNYNGRGTFNGVSISDKGKTVAATDGRRLHVVTSKEPMGSDGIWSEKSGKPGAKIDGSFPPYKDLVNRNTEHRWSVKIDQFYSRLRRAFTVAENETTNGLAWHANDPASGSGEIGFAPHNAEVGMAIIGGYRDGALDLGAINAKHVIEAIEFIKRTTDADKVTLFYEAPNRQLLIEAAGNGRTAQAIVMPVNHDASSADVKAKITPKPVVEANPSISDKLEAPSQAPAHELGKAAMRDDAPRFSRSDTAGTRPGHPKDEELARKAWHEKGTDSPWFKRWFGDSKVVDESGKPMVVYHGSPDIRFVNEDGVFKSQRERFGMGRGDGVHWFASTQEAAKTYADPHRAYDYQNAEEGVVTTYLKMMNPLIIDGKGGRWRDVQNRGKTSDVIAQAKAAGHDGVIIRNVKDDYNNTERTTPTTTYAVFDPTQIKSATANRGTFDGGNADIRYSKSQTQGERLSLDDETKLDLLFRKLVDDMNPIDRMQRDIGRQGGNIDEVNNVYEKQTVFHGKTAERHRVIQDEYVKPIVDTLAKSGIAIEQADQFLAARHALGGRNAEMRQRNNDPMAHGGMDDATAMKVLAEVKASGKQAEYQKIGDLVEKMNNATLDGMVADGLLSPEEADRQRNQWEYYVPMRSDMEAEGMNLRAGKGFQVRGKESKSATGRTTMADSPLTFSIMAAQEKAVRGEKNRVGQSLLKFVEDNPDDGLWTIDKHKTIKTLADDGTVKLVPDNSVMNADNAVIVKRDGQQHVIEFKGDAGLLIAKAIKRLGVTDGGPVVRALGKALRMYSQLQTNLNPDFIIPNLIRDFQTAGINLTAEKHTELAKDFAKGVPSAMKAVWDVMGDHGTKPGSKMHDALREYLQAGGKVDGYALNDFNATTKQIAALLKDASPTASRRVLLGVRKVGEWIDRVNGSVETSTRLAAYAAARQHGLSPQKAAVLAKNLTVNFNRHGEMGGLINSFYMFANAGIQGNARFFKAMATTPRGRKIAAGIAAAGLGYALAAPALFGKDDEGRNIWDNIPDGIKRANLLIPNPTSKSGYIKIPLPYGYNILWNAGRLAGQAATGAGAPAENATNFVASAFDTLNPVGSSSTVLQSIAPTMIKPLAESAENKDWAGRQIVPDQSPFGAPKPDSQLSYKTNTEMSKAVTGWLNSVTGGDEVTPGKLDISPATMDHYLGWLVGGTGRFIGKMADVAQGNTDTRNIPVVSRLAGEYDSSRVTSQEVRASMKAGQIAQARYDFYRKNNQPEKAAALKDDKDRLFYEYSRQTRKDAWDAKDNGDEATSKALEHQFRTDYQAGSLPEDYQMKNRANIANDDIEAEIAKEFPKDQMDAYQAAQKKINRFNAATAGLRNKTTPKDEAIRQRRENNPTLQERTMVARMERKIAAVRMKVRREYAEK